MANVTLRNVRKTYAGGFEAIKGINFDVGDGQFCVLVGPSGCGKSTLLRMVAGLETISSGEIDIGGRIVNQVEPADRDIAMVFQNYALYPHMSVYNNMAYGLRNRGMKEPEIDTRVQEAARILELAAMLERKPRQLSGGQRQRVAMGRAIVRQPKVFLFDEPLSNLDAKLRVQMRQEIRDLQQRLGESTVIDHFYDFLATRGAQIPTELKNRDLSQPNEPNEQVQREILRLYQSSPEVSILFELMTDFDEGLQEWRYRHIKLVERTIGAKHGTGGSPGVPFLKESLFKPIFHDLWAIRHQM
jgi:sn-glycerol 3-phosphate transport system ATP-binding protein